MVIVSKDNNKGNNKGFTLIELMVAMLILLVGGLALITSAAMVMEHNMTNQLRDEAVRVAEQDMSILRNTPFASLPAGPAVGGWGTINGGIWTAAPPPGSCQTVQRSFRGIQNFSYTVCERITGLSATTRQIDVAVGWDYKGTGVLAPTVRKYQHSASSIVTSN